MASRDADIRNTAAKIAAYAMLAQTSEEELSERLVRARAAQRQKDLDAVDPNGELSTEERERRATFRRRERLARAGLASAKARRDRQAAAEAARLAAELDALAAIDSDAIDGGAA